MRKANVVPTTSGANPQRPSTRRDRLGAAGSSGLLVIAAACFAPPEALASPADVDAELLAIGREAEPLAAQYNRNLQAFFALGAGSPDLDRIADLNDVPNERLDELVERATVLPATTLGGIRAKGVLLRHVLQSVYTIGGKFDPDAPGAFPEIALAWSLTTDLLHGSVA